MRLTKLKALELCEEMWRWLAKHPGKRKEGWPELDKYDPENYCFACEYSKQRGIEPGFLHEGEIPECSHKCILAPLWPNGCINGGSYSEYLRNRNKKKNALIIADFCKAEIKKLNSRRTK